VVATDQVGDGGGGRCRPASAPVTSTPCRSISVPAGRRSLLLVGVECVDVATCEVRLVDADRSVDGRPQAARSQAQQRAAVHRRQTLAARCHVGALHAHTAVTIVNSSAYRNATGPTDVREITYSLQSDVICCTFIYGCERRKFCAPWLRLVDGQYKAGGGPIAGR